MLYVLCKAGYFVAVAFANIFMLRIETEIISKSKTKPLEWKRCIRRFFQSLWETGRETINQFVLEANTHYPRIKFKLKFQRMKQLSQTPMCLRARDFTETLSLKSVHILKRQRHFNTRISLPVTLRA